MLHCVNTACSRNHHDHCVHAQRLALEDNDATGETEMRVLEASIEKITQLLGVAFGVAGVEIISENMRSMGTLNAIVPGRRTVRTCIVPLMLHLLTVAMLAARCPAIIESLAAASALTVFR